MRGSRATTEPSRSPSWSRATSWTSLRTDTVRLPTFSGPRSRSPKPRTCWSKVWPVSRSEYCRSRPVEPYRNEKKPGGLAEQRRPPGRCAPGRTRGRVGVRDALGEHRAVGGGDGAAGPVEVLADLGRVERVGVEVRLVDDLDPVELRRTGPGSRRSDADAEATDAAVHAAPPPTAGTAPTRRDGRDPLRLVADAQQQGQQHVVHDQRRAAVGHERQRHPGEGEQPGDAADDDERLERRAAG